MRYAIIAAGEGSRLVSEGILTPKPLVEVCGEALIDRLIRIFMQNDAEEIVVICNDKTALTGAHLSALERDGLRGMPVPLRFTVKSTPSSMHSLYEISSYLTGAPYCLTTVDTIFDEDEFRGYIRAFRQAIERGTADGVMGVTTYVDDEKPLYVSTKPDMTIKAFLDTADASAQYVSGGIYGLSARSLDILSSCIRRGESRLRNFQRALVASGFRLCAYPFTKVLDIDHASDIVAAEQFISGEQ